MTTATQLAPRQESLPTIEPAGQTAALMHIIEQASLDPNMDVAKLEKLLDLKERWDDKQAKLVFDAAMARVQSRIQPILADAQNTQTGSRYAKLKAIVASLAPIYTAEGFSVSFGTAECSSEKLREAGWIRTTSELTHESGYTKTYHVDLPLDIAGPSGKVNKTQIHGAKSAITYSRVILMGLMFNFTATEDVDDDGNGAGTERITDEQAATIRDYIQELEIDEPKYLEVLGAASVEDIPARKHHQAMSLIERKRKAVGK